MDDELEKKLTIIEIETDIKMNEDYVAGLKKQLKLLKNEK